MFSCDSVLTPEVFVLAVSVHSGPGHDLVSVKVVVTYINGNSVKEIKHSNQVFDLSCVFEEQKTLKVLISSLLQSMTWTKQGININFNQSVCFTILKYAAFLKYKMCL